MTGNRHVIHRMPHAASRHVVHVPRPAVQDRHAGASSQGRPLAHHREDFVAWTVGLRPALLAHVGSLGGGAAVAGWIAEFAWLAEVAGSVPYASSMSWSSARV